MIDIGKILKRAWHVLWNYKMLWIFGLLLAITAGGAGSNNGSGYRFDAGERWNSQNNYDPEYQPGPEMQRFIQWFDLNVVPVFEHPGEHVATYIWIGVGLLLFILVVSAIHALIRYPAETAVLRMVDEHEQSGTRLGFKQGWKLGWTKRAFRLWLLDLIIGLPALLFVLLLLGAGILLFTTVENGGSGAIVLGSVTAIACAGLFFFALGLFMVFVGLLREFFARAIALEEASVGDAFRNGWKSFKANWKSAALMWLVMLGIGFGFGIAAMIAFFLLIPAYLLTGLAGLIVAALPGAIAYGITSLFAGSILSWIVAAVVALPIFFTVLFSPISFVSGLYIIFSSTVWTLSWREMKVLENLEPKPAETLPPMAS
jgi:membrane-anchored glycerophosphoryl diester phosphodiesterase (GDPDase)